MLVSQYIYTACGKERTGAFSVFSKSKDITEEESTEIREVMLYKAPPGLPYEPTEQQIEELWPKKFGYFLLSSGRACLAHVSYVGRVYSDQDGRSGNYIIHAFVFNKSDNLSPYSFIEHDKFKRLLTRKEWHDDPIPDFLPQIDIPENGGTLSSGEMSSFFNDDRKNKLKLLIEAIAGSSDEKPVCFADDPANLKFWFKILSVCLPKGMQNAVSVCTHFTNTLVPGNASMRIQMRVNQPDNYQFNYAQEAQKGNYAFDFTKNIVPESLKPGKFAESVVKALSTSAFEAVKIVDSINKIVLAYSVTINEASVLLNINGTDYSAFENDDEVYNAILLADSKGYETQSVANNLLSKMALLKFSAQQRLDVFAFIYKNKPDTRVSIIQRIVDNADQFGIRMDGPVAFRDDLKSKANFIFANYLDYLKKEGLANYATKNQDSFNKLFLTFDFLVGSPAISNPTSEEMTVVKTIMASAFKRQSLADIDLLMNSANARSNGLGVGLLAVIVKAVTPSVSAANVQFSFDILGRVRTKTEVAYGYLLALIKVAVAQDGFIKSYIAAQNKDPDFYDKFESDNKKDSVVVDFCKKKDMFRFESQSLDIKALKGFFDKYYITGADKTLFVKRLGEYLSKIPQEKRISECDNVVDKMKFPPNADKMLLVPVYCAVLEAIFSLPYANVFEACKKKGWLDGINELYNVIPKAGGLKADTRELIILTFCGKIQEKDGFRGSSEADTKTLADKFDLVTSGKNMDVFLGYYFQPVVNILISWATDKTKQFKPGGDAERMFEKIIEKGTLEKLTGQIVAGLRKSKTNASLTILYLFKKCLIPSPNKLDKKLGEIVEDYFESLSCGFFGNDRKKTFTELLKLAQEEEKEQFQKYFDDFNKTHKK